jgi:heme exporter protein D
MSFGSFGSFSEFLAMSGYGAYVWSCFGLTAVVMTYMAWRARRELATEIIRTKRRNQAAEQRE